MTDISGVEGTHFAPWMQVRDEVQSVDDFEGRREEPRTCLRREHEVSSKEEVDVFLVGLRRLLSGLVLGKTGMIVSRLFLKISGGKFR